MTWTPKGGRWVLTEPDTKKVLAAVWLGHLGWHAEVPDRDDPRHGQMWLGPGLATLEEAQAWALQTLQAESARVVSTWSTGTKVHWCNGELHESVNGLPQHRWTLCGRVADADGWELQWSTDPQEVTCKRCLRRLRLQGKLPQESK